MEDALVAKILLSAVIGKDIEVINFLPQEIVAIKTKTENPNDKEKSFKNITVYRLDFAAKIKDEKGHEELIIIEVQKSNTFNDSMRFRRCLGKQYMNESHFKLVTNEKGHEIKSGTPIYSIYFLGEALNGFENHPIVKIHYKLLDNTTKEIIQKDDDFIKSLYHNGTIINISALKDKRREELEILLSIFDQDNITEDMHIVNVKEHDFPAKYRPIIKRLKQAVADKEVREIMELEDEYLKEILDFEKRFAAKNELYLEAKKQKEEERKQKEEERKQKEEAIILLLKTGMSKEEIAHNLGLSIDYVASLQK